MFVVLLCGCECVVRVWAWAYEVCGFWVYGPPSARSPQLEAHTTTACPCCLSICSICSINQVLDHAVAEHLAGSAAPAPAPHSSAPSSTIAGRTVCSRVYFDSTLHHSHYSPLHPPSLPLSTVHWLCLACAHFPRACCKSRSSACMALVAQALWLCMWMLLAWPALGPSWPCARRSPVSLPAQRCDSVKPLGNAPPPHPHTPFVCPDA